MILDRVTITGADDSVDPRDLATLARRFPFVEWGLLLSHSLEGSPRYPSYDWMRDLADVQAAAGMRLSGHLCGQWMRALLRGPNRFRAERPAIAEMFRRVQLNTGTDPDLDIDHIRLVQALRYWDREEYIVQWNGGVGNRLYGVGFPAVALFDKSGGAGVEPGEWPAPIGSYCGYAGGLHPDKLAQQLESIALAAGPSRVWVDMETHVRSGDGTRFDLAKVEKALRAAEPWVTGAKSEPPPPVEIADDETDGGLF